MNLFAEVINLIIVSTVIYAGFLLFESRYVNVDAYRDLFCDVEQNRYNAAMQTMLQHYYFIKKQLKENPDDPDLLEELAACEKDIDILLKQKKELEGDLDG